MVQGDRELASKRWTRIVNNTGSEIQIKYDMDVYTVNPMSNAMVQWDTYDEYETLLPSFHLKGHAAMSRYISIPPRTLYESTEIIVESKGVNMEFSYRTFSYLEFLKNAVSSMEKLLLTMAEHLEKVKIWRMQCTHLFERYRGGVGTALQEMNILITMMGGERFPVSETYKPFIDLICPQLLSSMLEAEELLLFCGDGRYKKAAFELSSPIPSKPTFSRFFLVLRTLHWILESIQCYLEQVLLQNLGVGSNISPADWRWCEMRCRTIFCPRNSSTMQGMYIEADGNGRGSIGEDEHFDIADLSRQIEDRYALLHSLQLKSASTDLATHNEDKLEAIWMKRLRHSSSQTCGSDSILDCFLLDSLDFEIKGRLGGGAFKQVYACKWEEEVVAVAIVEESSKKHLREVIEKEVGHLATVQHPNVVQLVGFACKDSIEVYQKKFSGHIVTELMEEGDLQSLISHQLRIDDGSETTTDGPPFTLPVAIDIALQIVEAMVHVHNQCRVLHRDLKPENCLVRPKYDLKRFIPRFSDVPLYYTIKLVDFGIAKMPGIQNSNFYTPRQGTPSYMAPEVQGPTSQAYTWSADVWSFGMLCYKLFTGKDPFETKTLKYVSEGIREGKRPIFPTGFPEELKKLIQRCWDKTPSARPRFQDIRRELWQIKTIWMLRSCNIIVPSSEPLSRGRARGAAWLSTDTIFFGRLMNRFL